jgi:hypothetical protein
MKHGKHVSSLYARAKAQKRTTIHSAHTYKAAMWAKQAEEKSQDAYQKRQRARGRGPLASGLASSSPANTSRLSSALAQSTNPPALPLGPGKCTGGSSTSLAQATHQPPQSSRVLLPTILSAWGGLITGHTQGDGDCVIHSVRTVLLPLSLHALRAANGAARQLRQQVVDHARSQSAAYKTQAGTKTWAPDEWVKHTQPAVYSPAGEPPTSRTATQLRKSHAGDTPRLTQSAVYLPPALMPSLAACTQKDIIVLTRHPASGKIDPRPHIYLAIPTPTSRGNLSLVNVQPWQSFTQRFQNSDTTRHPKVLIFDGPQADTTNNPIRGHYTPTYIPDGRQQEFWR